jgi:hypothetical protein
MSMLLQTALAAETHLAGGLALIIIIIIIITTTTTKTFVETE